jgi:hypothetical protein
MRLRYRRDRRLVAAAAASALAVSALGLRPRTAAAHHTSEQRLTDGTAYTLPKKSFRAGLLMLEYSVIDPVTLGTYWPVWLFRTGNLHAKWRFYQQDPWAFSVRAAAFWLDTRRFEELDDDAGDARISVGTLEPAASYRFDERYTLSSSIVYSEVRVDGELERDAFRGAAAGAVDNLQLTLNLERRVSRVTAFVLQARYLVFQRAWVNGDATLRPDDYTTVEVHAAATSDALDYPHAFSLVLSSVFSWRTFNLRFGLGYGNYNVPGVNFVLEKKTLIPDLDLYFVF